MSKAASQYLREVKKRIPCSGSQKMEFLCQLEAEVIYYCEDHENVDFAALAECFGQPDEVANDFLSELGSNTINKASLIRQRVMYLSVFTIVMATLIAAGVKIYAAYKQQQALEGYYIESITYEGELSPGATSQTYESEYYYSEEEIQNTE